MAISASPRSIATTRRGRGDCSDLQISNSSEADRPLGRYGRMALEYLKDNQPERYTILKMDGSLMEVMHRVQDEAMEKIEG